MHRTFISLLACVLLLSAGDETKAADIVEILPASAVGVVDLDINKLRESDVITRLIGKRSLQDYVTSLIPDQNFASLLQAYDVSPGTQKTLGSINRATIVILNSVKPLGPVGFTLILDGDFDESLLAKELKSAARYWDISYKSELVGKYEVTTLGHYSVMLLDKSRIVVVERPRRGFQLFSKQVDDGVLDIEHRQLIDEIVRCHENNQANDRNARLLDMLKNRPIAHPVVLTVYEPMAGENEDKIEVTGFIDWKGEHLIGQLQTACQSEQKAVDGELDSLVEIRKAANALSALPIARCLKDTTVSRTSRIVTIQASATAEEVASTINQVSVKAREDWKQREADYEAKQARRKKLEALLVGQWTLTGGHDNGKKFDSADAPLKGFVVTVSENYPHNFLIKCLSDAFPSREHPGVYLEEGWADTDVVPGTDQVWEFRGRCKYSVKAVKSDAMRLKYPTLYGKSKEEYRGDDALHIVDFDIDERFVSLLSVDDNTLGPTDIRSCGCPAGLARWAGQGGFHHAAPTRSFGRTMGTNRPSAARQGRRPRTHRRR